MKRYKFTMFCNVCSYLRTTQRPVRMEGLAQGEEYRRGTEGGGEVEEEGGEEEDEEGCGPECRNLLHEVGPLFPVGS